MAKDMLDAVYKAEEECKQREIEASKSSLQKSEEAKQKAEKLIIDAEAEACAEADKICNLAKSEGDRELDKAKAEADKQCCALSQIAEKNRNSVIKSAVNLLVER